MTVAAFLHSIEAMRFELDDQRREPARQVMKAIGDEHSHPRDAITHRAFLAMCDGTLREYGAKP